MCLRTFESPIKVNNSWDDIVDAINGMDDEYGSKKFLFLKKLTIKNLNLFLLLDLSCWKPVS